MLSSCTDSCYNECMAQLENFRLVVFRAVAQLLSFRKAGEELYLSQPAVSAQIKALEEDLGVQLFERSAGKVLLTNAGEMLLRYSKESHRMADQIESELGALKGEYSGELALGASTTIAQYALPDRLGQFHRQHPRVDLHLRSGNTEEIVQAIEANQIALGLVEGPPRSAQVHAEAFLRDELLLIVPGGSEWAERTTMACRELPKMPLLMRERGSGTRRVVEMALEKKRIALSSLSIVMELDSTEAIKSAVAAGLGAGFVSQWALKQDSRYGSSLRVIPLEGLTIERDFLLLTPLGKELQGAPAEFRRLLLDRHAPKRT